MGCEAVEIANVIVNGVIGLAFTVVVGMVFYFMVRD